MTDTVASQTAYAALLEVGERVAAQTAYAVIVSARLEVPSQTVYAVLIDTSGSANRRRQLTVVN